jgi:hypothetical protein
VLAPIIAGAGVLVLFLFLSSLFGLFRRPSQTAPLGSRRRAFLDDIALDLAEAGIESMSPERFIGYSVLVGVLVATGIFLASPTLWLIAVFAGFAAGAVGFRSFYIGRLARRRRNLQMKHLVTACRDIAGAIDAGSNPDEALEMYARTIEDNSVESLTNEPNQIAEMIGVALRLRGTRGLNLPDALRESADTLGNRYYRGMIETYIRNEKTNKVQLAKALRLYAEDVNYVMSLQRELRNAMSLPLASYMTVGALSAGVALWMVLTTPIGGQFYFGDTYSIILYLGDITLKLGYGQIFVLGAIAWWYTGYHLQRRKLQTRY